MLNTRPSTQQIQQVAQQQWENHASFKEYMSSVNPSMPKIDVVSYPSSIHQIKAMWEPGSAFVTPPGWWHSHHNDSDEDAIVLPIQDAGLIMNMQVLDFQFIK